MFRIAIKLLSTAAIQFVAMSSISVAEPPRVLYARVDANPSNFNGRCPTTITFTGRIRMTGPGEVKYVWVRSDRANSEVQSIIFPAPGELEVTTTWTLGGPGFPDQDRWEVLRILSPNNPPIQSSAARFRVRCFRVGRGEGEGQEAGQGQQVGQGQEAGQGQEPGQGQGAAEDPQPGQQQHGPGLGLAAPDLIVASILIPHPNEAHPRAFFHVRNNGSATAPGTIGTHDPDHGFMIDVVLSTDREVPAEPAVFSPNFSEDVMIRGGRISRTTDLPARAPRPYSLTIQIPVDTPPGNYFLCARIDPLNKVMESIEANNTTCTPFNVRPRR